MKAGKKFILSFLFVCTAFVSVSLLTAGKQADLFRLDDFVSEILQKLRRMGERLPEDKVYLHFDKPFYKPGETVWFSAYVRDGESLKASGKSDIVNVELIGPRGNVEKKHKLIAKDGMAKGDFSLDAAAAGGMYKVKAYTEWQKNDPDPAFFEKEIQVQAVVLPRLKMKLDFQREAYGAGDEVVADLILESNDNRPLANHPFSYSVSLRGEQILKEVATSGTKGEVAIKFRLPKTLQSNDGLLNIMLDYQGLTESISRSVPIVLNSIQLALYPEGGDLIAGLPGRVAFKALNEFDKPADIEGVVLDDAGTEVASFSSFHMGMGAFDLTSQEGRSYTVKITKPVGVQESYAVPEPLPRGFSMKVESVTESDVILHVHSTEVEPLSIIANVRGKNYFAATVQAKTGKNLITIPLKDLPIGVARITLFDSKGIARAERLAFVNKNRQLNIDVKTDKEKYLPREEVKMTVRVTDERGMPMPANLSVSVADDQLLAFADDKSSNILSWLLVESDIKGEVEEPNFYFDPKEEKATAALDYLLMTSGWRRFGWKEIMAETLPLVSTEGERAVVGGVVIDGSTGQPIGGVTVSIPGMNRQVVSDTDGRFLFKNLDIENSPNNLLQFSNKGQIVNQQWVNGFNDKVQAQAWEPDPVVVDFFMDADMEDDGVFGNEMMLDEVVVVAEMPQREIQSMAASVSGVRVENSRSVQIRGGRSEKKRAENKPSARPAPSPDPVPRVQKVQAIDIPAQDAVALGMEDLEGFAQILPVEEEVEMGWAGANVEDMRMPVKEMQNKDNAAGPNVIYYRAREFAGPTYQRPQDVQIRNDFRSTLYWNGNVEIGRSGKTTLSFFASDAVTSFRITVEGIAADGMPGRSEKNFYTQLPFSMATKMPLAAVAGDRLKIPLTLVNNTTQAIEGELSYILPDGLEAVKTLPQSISLEPMKARTVFLDFEARNCPEADTFSITFRSWGFADAFEQMVKVVPRGFPVELAFSGTEADASYEVIMQEVVDGSANVGVIAFPSTVSELISGLESMLREPSGCFEQTSSSTYPNIMVLNYMQETDQVDVKLRERALGMIERGYQRLISFETPEKGFEWFGQAPGHEGLTAYGLLEYTDMQKVFSGVDQKMIDRTAEWLMSRRDGKGGFMRNPRALHQFGIADQASMNAYIVFALTEAGYSGLEKELETSFDVAMKTKNPYHLGLVANACYNYKQTDKARKALAELLKIQQMPGNWNHTDKDRSAPGSQGNALVIESTALAMLAMMKDANPDFAGLKKASEYLRQARSGWGGFGSTQSTVFALRALTRYAAFSKRTDEDGKIEVYVDGKKVAETEYAKGVQDPVTISGLQEFLAEGAHKVRVKFVGVKSPLPYTLAVNYHTTLPVSSKACVIDLDSRLAKTDVRMGETVRLTTKLTNKTGEGQAMTLAIVSLPAGLTAQPWQLKELQEKAVMDFYEIRDNDLVLYYRQMKPSETREVNLDLKAEIPGTFDAPASSAYLYYTNEHKQWTALETVNISE